MGKVIHAHILFCVSAGDYAKPDLWGVLGPLPDEGTPSYIKITPLHLATSYYFLGVSHTKFESALSGLSTEGEGLEDLAQDPADGADGGSCWIQARGVCFLPSNLVGGLYDLGEHPTIAKVAPQLFSSFLSLSIQNPLYGNFLNWFQATFIKVVWKSHTTSYLDGPIRKSRSWMASDFEGKSMEVRQASYFSEGAFQATMASPSLGTPPMPSPPPLRKPPPMRLKT